MKNVTSRVIFLSLSLILLAFAISTAEAANPATITVTVTIQNLSVSASGPIAFGTVTAGSNTVATDSSRVTNNGNVPETYSLSLTNPPGWTATWSAAGPEQYCLCAMFNSTHPVEGDFSHPNDALRTVPDACTVTRFAGNQTGVSVAAGATRNLWLHFEAPSSTIVTTQQTIVVTVTAAAG
jgi:hypothetical protein